MDTDRSKNTTKFLRLILLSYDTSLSVTKAFTKFNILPNYGNSLVDFLNHHKHTIYHLWRNDAKCCQVNCNIKSYKEEKMLKKHQLLKLYNFGDTSVPGLFIKCSKVVKYCICGLSVNSSCSLDKLDSTLLNTLIRNCGNITEDEALWINTIRDVRNKLAHVESVSVFDEGRLQKWWDKLEGSVLGLASKTTSIPGYTGTIEREIKFLKRSGFDVDEAITIFDRIKEENSKLKDMIIEEHVQTRDIILKNQAEQTEMLKNTIESVKDEVIKLLNKDKVPDYDGDVCSIQVENQTEVKSDKQIEAINKICRVEWRLQTPDSWQVEQISNALQGASQMLKNWFQVEFVYVGSIVIITSVSCLVFDNLEVLLHAIRSFIQFIVNVCEMDVNKPDTINVDFKILHEKDILMLKKDLKKTSKTDDQTDIESDIDNERSEDSSNDDAIILEDSELDQLSADSSSSKIYCGYCHKDQIEKHASWCFQCNATFCSDCKQGHKISKPFKFHQLISVDKYQHLPSSVITISPNCDRHQNELISYCVDHESSGCFKCMQEHHNTCTDIRPLSDITQSTKQSVSFLDLYERARDIVFIAENTIRDISANNENIKYELGNVRLNINNKRIAIRRHLVRIIKEISVEESSEIAKNRTTVSRLECICRNITKVLKDINFAKKYASELHTFCGIKTWDDEIKRQEEAITILQNEIRKFSSMDYELIKLLNNFIKDIEFLGSLKLEYEDFGLICLRKERQGQNIVNVASELNDINVSMIQAFKLPPSVNKTDITGCCILESETMVFADGGNQRLVLMYRNLKIVHIIDLPVEPFDVTTVDNNSVAVSSHCDNKVVIVDIHSGEVIRTLYKGEVCYGLQFNGSKFFIIVPDNKYKVLDLDGNIMSTMENVSFTLSCCVGVDNLYFPAHVIDFVYCCDMAGKLKWSFKLEKDEYPRGIAIDSQENVFCNMSR